MNTSRRHFSLHHLLATSFLLSLPWVTAVSLIGDEPKAGKAETATSNVQEAATETSSDAGVVTDEPPEPVEVKLERVNVEAVSGDPLAVGVMEFTFVEEHGPVLYPDQPLFLSSSDQRAHYATFDVSYQEREGGSPWQVDRIRVSFLLRGHGPSQLTLSGVEGLVLEPQTVEIIEAPARHRALLQKWWKSFSTAPKELDVEQKMLKQSLLDILARRMNLPGPWPSVEQKDSEETTGLESQFENAIGMLFGIESVKLAMQEEVTLNESRWREKADWPIPPRPRMRGINIPSFPASTWVEPIAMHVPAECFYLRTGNLANYRYFRKFLLGWGGSLDDIVATRSLDHQTRQKIEGQLGLNPDAIPASQFDELISDMALIGCDPLFGEGAAIGLLFRARNTRGLFDVIKGQRNQAKLRVPGSMEKHVDVGAHAVSLLSSDDNRIRSFYAIDGEYHLVTNSRYLLDRFFAAGRGDRSLGSLTEFRYARSKTQEQRQTLAFLYLSDPFFRNLVSPHYRIEITRRRQAARELQRYQLARLMAKAEQIHAVTIDDLIDARFLPAGFARRPDGSFPLVADGEVEDSLRGAQGVFLPVPDVRLQKATLSEVNSYRSFVGKYNQEWRRVDPVTVVFSRDGSVDDHERVSLDIIITPYAQRKYAPLRQHLASASTHRVAPVDGDLLSLDTTIRTSSHGASHLLYLGLHDDNVPFAFENGQVKLIGRRAGTSFAKSRSYAAISPPSTDILRLLSSVIEQPKPARPATVSQVRPMQPPPVLAPPPVSVMERAFYIFGWALGSISPPKFSEVLRYTSNVTTRDGWMVASTDYKIRKDSLDELTEERIGKPSQVRLRMGSLSGSKVEPYIQAYTYMSSRRVSAENARFLNDFARWLNLPPRDARNAVENVLAARLRCPLGSDFKLHVVDGHPRWVGAAWPEASLYSIEKTPESWKFPFLNWIRRLDVQFDLDNTTLRAKVDLVVRQTSDPFTDGAVKELQMIDPRPTVSNVSQTAFLGGRPTTTRRPLADRIGTSAAPPSVASTVVPVASPRPVQPVGESRDSRAQRDWILGVRVSRQNQFMQVTHVYSDSPASRIGLRVGDEIRSVDRQSIGSHEQLVRLLDSARNRTGIAVVQVLRQGSSVTFNVRLSRR